MCRRSGLERKAMSLGRSSNGPTCFWTTIKIVGDLPTCAPKTCFADVLAFLFFNDGKVAIAEKCPMACKSQNSLPSIFAGDYVSKHRIRFHGKVWLIIVERVRSENESICQKHFKPLQNNRSARNIEPVDRLWGELTATHCTLRPKPAVPDFTHLHRWRSILKQPWAGSFGVELNSL
jgi:hypothetical protein